MASQVTPGTTVTLQPGESVSIVSTNSSVLEKVNEKLAALVGEVFIGENHPIGYFLTDIKTLQGRLKTILDSDVYKKCKAVWEETMGVEMLKPDFKKEDLNDSKVFVMEKYDADNNPERLLLHNHTGENQTVDFDLKKFQEWQNTYTEEEKGYLRNLDMDVLQKEADTFFDNLKEKRDVQKREKSVEEFNKTLKAGLKLELLANTDFALELKMVDTKGILTPENGFHFPGWRSSRFDPSSLIEKLTRHKI